MTAAWIKVANDQGRKEQAAGATRRKEALLSRRVVHAVTAVTFPVGVGALIYFAYLPNAEPYGAGGIDLGEWNSSSWTMITQSWSGLALMALIYCYGFRRIYVVLIGLYLLIMAIQGFDRFRVVMPLLFLLLVWLSRTGRRWPPTWMVVTGIALIIIMLPLKTIGRMLQAGQSSAEVMAASADALSDVAAGQSGDQMVLDEFASTVSLVDESQRHYYGALYYPLITLPIPRQWWPDKPALNWYQRELSTSSRPMALSGMVSTLHGESYANIGVLGVIAISAIVAYALGYFYFAAIRRRYMSIYRFTYIVIVCSLIQVFRDGLVSLVMFTLVNMTPLVVIAVLSYISWRRKGRVVRTAPSYLLRRHRGHAQA
jgi:hypothetical protein